MARVCKNIQPVDTVFYDSVDLTSKMICIDVALQHVGPPCSMWVHLDNSDNRKIDQHQTGRRMMLAKFMVTSANIHVCQSGKVIVQTIMYQSSPQAASSCFCFSALAAFLCSL